MVSEFVSRVQQTEVTIMLMLESLNILSIPSCKSFLYQVMEMVVANELCRYQRGVYPIEDFSAYVFIVRTLRLFANYTVELRNTG
jgi:hypothetical protein